MVFVNFILPFVIDCPEILLFILTFAICGAWFLYFLLRMDDAVLIRCNNCGKDIETDRPWVCGVCHKAHTNASEFSFLGNCVNCGAEPKAYQCHHCLELIFLSKDELKLNFATCANLPIETKPVKQDKVLENIAKLGKDIEITQLKVKKAELDVTLKGLNENLAPPPKKKTAYEELEEYYLSMVGNDDAAEKWKAAIDAEFKNNPKERKKRHLVVKQWMLNRS
jgi:hypothetical protein